MYSYAIKVLKEKLNALLLDQKGIMLLIKYYEEPHDLYGQARKQEYIKEHTKIQEQIDSLEAAKELLKTKNRIYR